MLSPDWAILFKSAPDDALVVINKHKLGVTVLMFCIAPYRRFGNYFLARFFLAALLLMAVSSTTQAANVNVSASGAMTVFSDPDGLLPFAEPAPGTVFALDFTYDDATPGSGPPTPSFKFYTGAISTLTLDVGGLQYGLGQSNSIFVGTDLPDLDVPDTYLDLWSAETRFDAGSLRGTIGLVFVAYADAVPIPLLDTTALVEPPWPANWTAAKIYYEIDEEIAPNEYVTRAEAEASLQSLAVTTVPVPAAAWLFGSAVIFMAGIRRRVAGP